MKTPVIAIIGPTALGKSDLAVFIAKKTNGEIVSADSRQVYKGMNIGTGKITPREARDIPHHMLDTANPLKRISVAQYVAQARGAATFLLFAGEQVFTLRNCYFPQHFRP